jgi:hypothetical protein
VVRRTGPKALSLFHRLGILFVILGTMQSLAPNGLRPMRPSPTESSRQDQEPDQESQDGENLAESLVWPEALTERRSPVTGHSRSPLDFRTRPARPSGLTCSARPRKRTFLDTSTSHHASTCLGRFLF